VTHSVLFANPTAQSGKAAEWIAEARKLLDAAGIDHDFIPTEPHGGTVGLVRRAIEEDGAERVVYMGGDGTFAEVAKGILGSDNASNVAMGMLPMGTANDQGKSFGLRAGFAAIEENIAVIAAGVTTNLDVGRVQRLDEADQVTDSDLFFDSMSIGLGAEVLVTRNRDREAVASIPFVRSVYRDKLVYVGALLQKLAASYVGSPTFDLEAEIDGEVHYYKSIMDVIVKNTHVYGGEWVLAPDAESDDGLFEMVPIATCASWASSTHSRFPGRASCSRAFSPVQKASRRRRSMAKNSLPATSSASMSCRGSCG
jgi:diacylglycerol kinase family enzyme